MSASLSAADALAFCRSNPSAVVVTVWPTAHALAAKARAWIEDDCNGVVLHAREVDVDRRGAVATCMALYFGEDWIHSNCWYGESPLPEGPPEAPYAGGKWKAALTWRAAAPLTVFVVDASSSGGSLWSSKYRVREALRREAGALGNGCVHLTDDQASALAAWKGGDAASPGQCGGYACDSSYAYHCARVLLDESSVAFLNAADAEAPEYAARFDAYAAWLQRDDDSTEAPAWG